MLRRTGSWKGRFRGTRGSNTSRMEVDPLNKPEGFSRNLFKSMRVRLYRPCVGCTCTWVGARVAPFFARKHLYCTHVSHFNPARPLVVPLVGPANPHPSCRCLCSWEDPSSQSLVESKIEGAPSNALTTWRPHTSHIRTHPTPSNFHLAHCNPNKGPTKQFCKCLRYGIIFIH